jgi:CRISPR system Cascade subunit CasC
MFIDIHAVQNHSPANLNRDDLGAPKTCYFGGVIRSRISSQCIKRSIRRSDAFKCLCGGIRTRRLAELISKKVCGEGQPEAGPAVRKRAAAILERCGIAPKDEAKSDVLVYTTYEAVAEMSALLREGDGKTEDALAEEFGRLIVERTAVPDMALSGRMLETGVLQETTVDAALQVAHAISTHEARPEIDYYVAADDLPGDDAGAGFVDEALFASACFYKYFSVHWEALVRNLKGNEKLAAHTVGAFLRGAVTVNPTGKQNSFASHCRPDGVLVEIKGSPLSYANAYANPAAPGERDIIAQSIAQLAQYVRDLDVGFGKPEHRFWFSPNLRYPLAAVEGGAEVPVSEVNVGRFDDLIAKVVAAIGHDWAAVQAAVLQPEWAP